MILYPALRQRQSEPIKVLSKIKQGGARSMATIGQLNQQISNLRKENDELKTELDEYKSLNSALASVIEAHISCREHDKSVVNAASLMPSNCITSVLNELRALLNTGSSQALAGNVSSLSGKIIEKQARIGRQISSNEDQIRSCQFKISQLKKTTINDPTTVSNA